MTEPSPPEKPKKFHIQRLHVGSVKFVEADGKYGFIEAENYRDDVFFHSSVWESSDPQHPTPTIELLVEFELDEGHRDTSGQLRAKTVRPTKRPGGAQLEPHVDQRLVVKHHPRARRKRPSWRGD